MTMVPLYNQWESLLKWFPDSNVLNYPCSYSALFNLHTLRTVCECRWQPTLSHEKESCTRDKAQLIWLQDMVLPKTQVYHIPTVSSCCLVFQLEYFFKYFYQISRRSKCGMLCSSTALTLLSTAFFLLVSLSLCLSPSLTYLHLLLLT